MTLAMLKSSFLRRCCGAAIPSGFAPPIPEPGSRWGISRLRGLYREGPEGLQAPAPRQISKNVTAQGANLAMTTGRVSTLAAVDSRIAAETRATATL